MPNFILAEDQVSLKNTSIKKLKSHAAKLVNRSSEFRDADFHLPDVKRKLYNALVEERALTETDGGNLILYQKGRKLVNNYQTSTKKNRPFSYKISRPILDRLRLEMTNLAVPGATAELGMKFYFGYTIKPDTVPGITYNCFSVVIVPVRYPEPDLGSPKARDHRKDEEDSFLLRPVPPVFFGLSALCTGNSEMLNFFGSTEINRYKLNIDLKEQGSYAAYYSYNHFLTKFIDKLKDPSAISYLLLEFGRLEGSNILTIVITAFDDTDKPLQGEIEINSGLIQKLQFVSVSFDNGDLYPPSNRNEEIFND